MFVGLFIQKSRRVKMTKLFVGSLPFETNEDELHALFSSHGSVGSAKIISDRETGRSRGFGFVEMSDDAQAQAAITSLNGSTVGTRQIVVNVAKPMEKRDGGFGGGRGGERGGGRW
jgi:RNA recognition motif-containing protein